MRRLLLSILILAVAASLADASGIIKRRNQAAAPDTCTSQAADVSIKTDAAGSTFYYGQDRGQSWKAGATGYLHSVSFKRSAADSEETTTWRIGTSNDLSTSYLTEFTCAIPNASTVFACVIPSGARPYLTSGTTYYIIGTSSTSWAIRRSTSDVYADGTAFFDTTADYIGTAATTDLYFITTMCSE